MEPSGVDPLDSAALRDATDGGGNVASGVVAETGSAVAAVEISLPPVEAAVALGSAAGGVAAPASENRGPGGDVQFDSQLPPPLDIPPSNSNPKGSEKPVGASKGTPLAACKVELHPLHPMLARQGTRTLEGTRMQEAPRESLSAFHPREKEQQPLSDKHSSATSKSSSSRVQRSPRGSSLPPSSMNTSWLLHPPGASLPHVKRWRLCIFQHVFLVMPNPSLWPSPSRCPPPSYLPCLFITRETGEMQQQLVPLQGFILAQFTACVCCCSCCGCSRSRSSSNNSTLFLWLLPRAAGLRGPSWHSLHYLPPVLGCSS